MPPNQVLQIYVALLTTLFSEACNIDFHTEHDSTSILLGNNASILCDATPCLPQHQIGDVSTSEQDGAISNKDGFLLEQGAVFSVVWTDPMGRTIPGPSGRNLVKRLVVSNAQPNIAGKYTCTIERNNVPIKRRSYEIKVVDNKMSLGASLGNIQLFPQKKYNRRGHFGVSVESINNGNASNYVNDLDINAARSYNEKETDDLGVYQNYKVYPRRRKRQVAGTDATYIPSAEPKETRTIVIKFVSEEDSAEQTTQDPSETTVFSATTLSSTPATVSTTSEAATSAAETTSESADTTTAAMTTTETTILTTPTRETTPDKTNSSGGVTDSNRGRPKWCDTEESFFGRRGLAAFSVTLGVAILLLCALLMVIFMPNIMRACHRGGTTINSGNKTAAVYRKKQSGPEAEAPMTLLSESTTDIQCEPEESSAQDVEKTNKSYDGDNEDDDDIKGDHLLKGNNNKEKPAVSTFLLRQNSLMESAGNEPKRDNSTQPPQSEAETEVELGEVLVDMKL